VERRALDNDGTLSASVAGGATVLLKVSAS